MNRAAGILLLTLLLGAPAEASEPAAGPPVTNDADWLAASSAFKLELHALAAETLMLQLRTPPPHAQKISRPDRRLRLDAGDRLSDSLRAANALLSMMEIAGHSDRGDRVREVLLLWLDSARRSLGEHRTALSESPAGGSPSPETVVFLEELKILWQRLDRAYADLQALIARA